jgi:HK97 gp10 family phage protein
MSVKITSTMKWDGPIVKVIGKRVTGNSAWEAGLTIEGKAKELCPVAIKYGGRLKGSITTQARDRSTPLSGLAENEDKISMPTADNTVYVGTACFYGPYQEYGTIKMNAQPYLRPAFDLSQGKALSLATYNGKTYFKDYLK